MKNALYENPIPYYEQSQLCLLYTSTCCHGKRSNPPGSPRTQRFPFSPLHTQSHSWPCLLYTSQRIRANFAVGLNCPVSIELMVFLDTPTISASWARAVSYTHLDVYKRQELNSLLTLYNSLCKEIKNLEAEITRLIEEVHPHYMSIPVSYTHLDVYKRQASYPSCSTFCQIPRNCFPRWKNRKRR